LNADDAATPTYSSDTFSVTKSDGTTVIGQQQGQYITVPNAGLNNADWSGEITLVSEIDCNALKVKNNFRPPQKDAFKKH